LISFFHLEAGTNTFYLFICASEVAYEFDSLSLSLSLHWHDKGQFLIISEIVAENAKQ